MHYQLNSPPCIAELVDGEYVVINLDSGKYYNIVGLGAQVFQYLTLGVSVPALLSAISEDNSFWLQLDQFISQAVDEGLLKAVVIAETSDLPKPVLDKALGIETLTINVYTDMQELLVLDPIHEVDEAQGWPNKA